MATSYYYYISGLPVQNLEDSKLILTPLMFLQNSAEQLTSHDYALLKLILLPNDLDNLISHILGEGEWLTESTISEEQWTEAINQIKAHADDSGAIRKFTDIKLPDFVIDFISKVYASETLPGKNRLAFDLYSAFYAWVGHSDNAYIRAWFSFDADLRNITVALNCRKHAIPLAGQLIGENEITEKLLTSHANDFGLGKDFSLFEQLSRINDLPDIIDKEKGFDALRWKWIENTNFFEYFSIDRILGYTCKVRIQYRWIHLSQSLGENRFNIVLADLENSLEFPEEFALKKR